MLSKCFGFCCGHRGHCFSRVWGQIIYQLENSLHRQHLEVFLALGLGIPLQLRLPWLWSFAPAVGVLFVKFVQMPLLHMILG